MSEQAKPTLVSYDGTIMEEVKVKNSDGFGFTMLQEPSEGAVKSFPSRPKFDLSDMPKFGWKTMFFVRYYFYAIRCLYKTESFVYFHRSAEDTDYIPVVPGGYIAGPATVEYDPNPKQFCGSCHIALPAGEFDKCPFCGDENSMRELKVLGTAHSHVDMAPFHSGTDNEHELNHTGFHFTFGYMDTGMFGTELSFAARNSAEDTAMRVTLTDSDCVMLPFEDDELKRLNLWLNKVAVDERIEESTAPETHIVVIGTSKAPVFAGTEEECDAFVKCCEGHSPAETKPLSFMRSNVTTSCGMYQDWDDIDDYAAWAGWGPGSGSSSGSTTRYIGGSKSSKGLADKPWHAKKDYGNSCTHEITYGSGQTRISLKPKGKDTPEIEFISVNVPNGSGGYSYKDNAFSKIFTTRVGVTKDSFEKNKATAMTLGMGALMVLEQEMSSMRSWLRDVEGEKDSLTKKADSLGKAITKAQDAILNAVNTDKETKQDEELFDAAATAAADEFEKIVPEILDQFGDVGTNEKGDPVFNNPYAVVVACSVMGLMVCRVLPDMTKGLFQNALSAAIKFSEVAYNDTKVITN